MFLLRPLFEAWLLRATEAPLGPWQRQLLLWALRRDENLRALAMELAEFSQPETAAKESVPDLRVRLRHSLEPAPSYAWRPGWATAAAALGLTAGLVGLWWLEPAKQNVELAQVQQVSEAAALRLPSATPSPTPTASPTLTPTPEAEASPTPTPTSTPN